MRRKRTAKRRTWLPFRRLQDNKPTQYTQQTLEGDSVLFLFSPSTRTWTGAATEKKHEALTSDGVAQLEKRICGKRRPHFSSGDVEGAQSQWPAKGLHDSGEEDGERHGDRTRGSKRRWNLVYSVHKKQINTAPRSRVRLATDLATNGPTEEVFTTVITLTRSTYATVSNVVYSFHSYYYTIPHILTHCKRDRKVVSLSFYC